MADGTHAGNLAAHWANGGGNSDRAFGNGCADPRMVGKVWRDVVGFGGNFVSALQSLPTNADRQCAFGTVHAASAAAKHDGGWNAAGVRTEQRKK